MSTKRRHKSGPPFIRLFRFVKRSQAYHDLSLPARCALIEIMDRYTGINNGMIGLSVRTLADELKCSHSTAGRALRQLDDSRLAMPLTAGSWRGKKATEWRLTFLRCDKTGELPNKNWPLRSQCHQESAKVSQRKHETVLSVTTKAQTPKNSINGNPLRFTGEAHIDIYHSGTGLDADTAEAAGQTEPYPELPEFLDRRVPPG